MLFISLQMKRHILFSLLCAGFLSTTAFGNLPTWQVIPNNSVASQGERYLSPSTYSSFYLNTMALKSQLATAGSGVETGAVIDIATPDGKTRAFKIWETPMMEAPLAEKYPEIKTYTGYAMDDKGATAKLDFTYKGFHAKIFDGKNTYFIDPYSRMNDGYYISYFKRDYLRPEGKTMSCEVENSNHEGSGHEEIDVTDPGLKAIAAKTNGTTQKTYRLALACTIEYSEAVDGSSPTKAGVLSAMVTSINRVNGVYERELAVTMNLIANNDTLIYLSGTDPYSNGNGGTMLSQNQTNVNTLIGSANYDIGHVFSTGGGGIAQLGSVCSNGNKARGVTGSTSPIGDPFDIDYVAHEMGHQYGANHPFNANTGSCNGNGESTTAYEPGSGSTIMAYAGICNSGDNLQNHSDDYFHAISLMEMSNYITVGNGANCPVQTPVANVAPTMPSFTISATIPANTPFELIAPNAIDSDNDQITYCWEQWNLGDFKSSHSPSLGKGPIIRSEIPSLSPVRSIPSLATPNAKGEQPGLVTRFYTFRLTVRDILGTLGTFNILDDTVHIDAINTGAPFAVTNPNTLSINWTGGTMETITWDVASTDVAPISTPNVDVYLSVDGGLTYPYVIATNIVNDGSEALTVPNVPTTSNARVKIKGAGNIFFDISNFDFTITNDPNLPVATNVTNVSWKNNVELFPVPVTNELHIKNEYKNNLRVTIFNTIGQQVWNGNIANEQTLNVSNWAKGMYYMQFTDTKNNERVVKKFVVE